MILHIGLRCIDVGKVSWIAGSTVDVCISNIYMIGIVGGSLPAHEVSAVNERELGRGYICRSPTTAHINGGEVRAIGEHAFHVKEIAGVEVAQIKFGKAAASPEHFVRLVYLISMQVLPASNFGEVGHPVEPHQCGGRACLVERGVEHHLGHILIGAVVVPAG